MNTKRLIADLGIIAVITIVSVLIYLALPSVARESDQISETPDTNLSTNTNELMPQQPSAQLHVDVLKEGTGDGAKNGDAILVHYTGKLKDGTVFDSSISRNEPFPLTLGKGEVIPGWELGLLGMKVGEERQLTIPPELGYGARGFPGVIPPNSELIFFVQLISIN